MNKVTTTARELANRTLHLSAGWLGAIAAGIGAGVALGGGGNRVTGGVIGGLAVWAFAMYQAEPCCAECAGASPQPEPRPMGIAVGEPMAELDGERPANADDWSAFTWGSNPADRSVEGAC